MRRFKRFLSLILAVAMLVCLYPSKGIEAKTASEISASISQKQKQIKESQAAKNSIAAKVKDAKAIKSNLEALKSDVSSYITQIDAEVADIEAQIEEYGLLISDKEKEIEEMTLELEEAVKNEENQYAAMKERIRFMYEQGDTFYLELMLTAKSFGDFLTKAQYINELSAYERKKMDEYTEAREWTELCKASLESEKQVLDEAKAAEESDREALNEILAEKEKELSEYNSKISSMNATISEYEKDLAEEQAVIAALEAQIAEEKKTLASMTKRTYDGGVFTFPCPSYTKVTDEFGWRTDPITGASSYHSGIDLGAPAGSPILAAYDGTVVSATYNWSMGNYVMIDHGDGLYTIYMHASALYVSSGQNVSAGQKIAAVGTTGRSTGNHLHFSVRLNGTYVSPWNYLK